MGKDIESIVIFDDQDRKRGSIPVEASSSMTTPGGIVDIPFGERLDKSDKLYLAVEEFYKENGENGREQCPQSGYHPLSKI